MCVLQPYCAQPAAVATAEALSCVLPLGCPLSPQQARADREGSGAPCITALDFPYLSESPQMICSVLCMYCSVACCIISLRRHQLDTMGPNVLRTLLFLVAPSAVHDFTVNLLITREVPPRRCLPHTLQVDGEACKNATTDRVSDLSDPSTDCACLAGAARRRAVMGPSDTAVTNKVTLDTGAYFSGSGKFFAAFEGNASAELFASVAYHGVWPCVPRLHVGRARGARGVPRAHARPLA